MHLESNLARCDTLDNVFQKKLNKRFDRVFQSIAIWFVDKTKNNINNDFYFKKYYFCFYLFGIVGFSVVVMDSLLRMLLKIFVKDDESVGDYNFGYVSFANSHELVLSRLKKQCVVDGGSSVNISARPMKELFSKKNNIQNIDGFISLASFIRQIKNSVSFLACGGGEAIEFLALIGKKISISDAVLLSIKIFQSLRFNTWSSNFFEKNSFDFIFLGNDTCYRAFWLINNSKGIKSITIQHGIPENVIQYYSISDYFVYWDSMSFDRLHKNPTVEYIDGGYPKEQLVLCNKSSRKNGLIAICTKFQNIRDLKLMMEFSKIMQRANIDFEIKFHPLETVESKKILSDVVEYLGEIKGVGEFSYVVVVDSTFAIDLVVSKREIIPLSFDLQSFFGEYFKPMLMENFLKKLNALNCNEIRDVLDLMQICEPKLKFSKFKFLEKSININGTLIC